MNNEEIQSLIKQLQASGLKEEEIMDVFYQAFTAGEMDRKDLETLSEAMGFELTDDFKNDPTPDPISSKDGEVTKEEAEDLKEIKPGESKEDFKEKVEEAKDSEEDSEDDEEEDWEKAQKMFKV